MNCPKCGNPVTSRRNTCENCGCDLTVYRKIIRISNGYYNRGLEKAKVRDLSGAVVYLKRSLEVNKRNTDARNLLGLVYYEMGEAVAALSQWVISKSFDPDDNEADYFMDKVRENPTELDTINQAVRKYNLALEAAKQGNTDTAVIQLRKTVGMYGHFLKALQLLALLYISEGEYERARKFLLKARQIDVNNTTTLRYLAEVERQTDPDSPHRSDDQWEIEDNANANRGRGIAAVGSYKEDKPNIIAFVNLLLGVIIGIAVVYYLIVPTIKSNLRAEYDSQKVDYSAELSSKTATIAQNEKTMTSLRKQIDDLQNELESVKHENTEMQAKDPVYDELFAVWKHYTALRKAEYTPEELQDMALELWALDMDKLENSDAKSQLQAMRDDIYPQAAREIYKTGREMYDLGDYVGAAGMLQAAVDLNPESDSAMYYLGRSFQALEQYDQAISYYKLLLEVCPNSSLKDTIPLRLRECGEGT